MSQPALRRFDRVIFKRKGPGDDSLTPASNGRVDFYRQGATVKTTTSIGNGAQGTVDVYGSGALESGDSVQAGLGGSAPLVVTNVDAVGKHVTLINSSGSDVTLTASMRLILVTRRPLVYSDPFGTNSLGSSLTADANGRATGYVAERKIDYVAGGVVVFDAVASSTVTNGSALSWLHTTTGEDRCVLVGISWRTTTTATLASVTYDGVQMVLVASRTFTALYAVVSPPTGSGQVIVSFTPGSVASAVGGSVSLRGVDQGVPIAASSSSSASSSTPTAAVPSSHDNGLAVAVLNVGGLVDPGSATQGTSQTSRWDSVLPVGGLQMRGIASTQPTTGGSVAATWNLLTNPPAPPWEMLLATLRPVASQLYIDADGHLFDATPVFNALDYQSLQSCVDSLPPGGGMVVIPPGVYSSKSRPRFDPPLTLPSDRPVRIVGAGRAITVLEAADEVGTNTLLMIRGDSQSAEGLGLRRPRSSLINTGAAG